MPGENANFGWHGLLASRGCRATRHGGFTLMELLVVAMLGTLVITFLAGASRWYQHSIKEMHVIAQLDKELKMASIAIAQDYGPALAARTTDGTDVEFDYDDGDSVAQWGAPDTLVQYVLSGGKLIRRDLAAGSEVPIATDISAVSASIVDGQLNVHLIATYRKIDQDLTLQLRDPG